MTNRGDAGLMYRELGNFEDHRNRVDSNKLTQVRKLMSELYVEKDVRELEAGASNLGPEEFFQQYGIPERFVTLITSANKAAEKFQEFAKKKYDIAANPLYWRKIRRLVPNFLKGIANFIGIGNFKIKAVVNVLGERRKLAEEGSGLQEESEKMRKQAADQAVQRIMGRLSRIGNTGEYVRGRETRIQSSVNLVLERM